jgi:basic membrane lipoprotein Med (substrate-binding protein (PBP1-ABC) superfamily)
VVIGQGFEFGEVATKVAPDYPDTIFLVTNNPDVQGPNLQGLQPASWEAAYLAGVAAGTVSCSGKVGGIAGQEFPVIVAQMEAFKLGVLSVDPGAVEGTFDGKPGSFGLDSDVLGLAPIRALPDDLASKVEAAVADAKAKILSGETEVPFIPEPTS